MSEEKRFTNKKLIVISIILVLFVGTTGVLGFALVGVLNGNVVLSGNYDDLLDDFNELNDQYFILTGEYIELENDYDDLLNAYNALQIAYDYICNTIRQSILPVQYSIFAEAVRRYYIPLYLVDGMTDKEWYMGYAEFCRDIILHDSFQKNSFYDVSNMLSEVLRYGSDTMNLTWSTLYCFDPWYNFWHYWYLTGNELIDIDDITQWCIDEIDYEYDSKITRMQENPTWDYPKFPVETMFRTMGDCEDQAILTATYLETCGFETAFAISHDPNHPTLGEFYHGHLLVHIEDTTAYYSIYSALLWNLGGIDPYEGYTWAWLDTTWDVPFGSTPSWLVDYGGTIEWDVLSIAFCDVDGNIGENTGLTCIMPT